jgi:hypothetical protein
MKNEMEQMNNNTEASPSFLRGFVEETESLAEEVLLNPETRGYFELPSGIKDVREGNASDRLRLKIQTTIYAANQLLKELRKEGHSTKEDFQNEKVAAKFVAFCEAQEPLSRLCAEAKDDPSLAELGEVYKKYIDDFARTIKQEDRI